MGRIDRRKQVADVMERVLGLHEEHAYAEATDVGERPWLAGTISTTVHIAVDAGPPDHLRSSYRGQEGGHHGDGPPQGSR